MSFFNFSFLISSKQDLSEHSICVNMAVMAGGKGRGGTASSPYTRLGLISFLLIIAQLKDVYTQYFNNGKKKWGTFKNARLVLIIGQLSAGREHVRQEEHSDVPKAGKNGKSCHIWTEEREGEKEAREVSRGQSLQGLEPTIRICKFIIKAGKWQGQMCILRQWIRGSRYGSLVQSDCTSLHGLD